MKKPVINSITLTLASCVVAVSAQAQTILLADSFEEGVASGNRAQIDPTGWVRPSTDVLQGGISVSNSARAGVYGETDPLADPPANDTFITPFGSNAAWIWGGNEGQHMVTNDTGLDHTITEGWQYTLSVNYGGDRGSAANALAFLYSDDGAGGYSVLNSATANFSGIQDTSGTLSFSYTAAPGDAAIGDKLRIRLDTGTSLASTFRDDFRNDVVYDNLSLSVVPEPSSFALLSGFLGLTWVMLGRRR